MTDIRFDLCLPPILKWEGGNDDDPRDHGGRTSRGVIQREYDKWRTAKGLATRDVWTASDQEIHDIYYEQYWLPVCPQLAPGVDLMFFNIAVNGGVRRAAVLLQRALNIPEDSDEFKAGHEHVGPVTLGHAASADPRALVNSFDQAVVAFYRGLAQFPIYGKGWLNRESDIHATALKMASAQPASPMPAPIPAPIQTQEPTMPTTTTAVAPATMNDPIPQIIAFLEVAKNYLPMVVGFLPPPIGPIATAAIPIIEEVLKLIEDAKTKSGVDLFQTIGMRIQAIGLHVQTTASTAAKVTAQPATSAGMPNS